VEFGGVLSEKVVTVSQALVFPGLSGRRHARRSPPERTTMICAPWADVLPPPWIFRGPPASELLIASDGPKLMVMALAFQVDDQGHPHPQLRCDVCGGVINDPSGGVVLWDQQNETPGSLLEPTFHCGGCVAQEGGAPPHSMPLELFMVYLMNNIQLTPGILESAGRNLQASASP
jgi:hypothetical protein